MADILFLAHRVPFPPDRGDRIRSWHVLKRLAQLAPVHLIAFSDSASIPQELRAVCASVCLVPMRSTPTSAALASLVTGRPASVELYFDQEFDRRVQDALRRKPISTVYAFSGQMAAYVPEDLGERRFIMDFVDVDSAKYDDLANECGLSLAKSAYRFEARRLAKFEKETAQRADVSLFVSQPEVDLFLARSGVAPHKVHAVPNGVDLQRYQPGYPIKAFPSHAPLIVFTGQMDYRPNVDAVTRFALEVFPLIREERPDVQFAIVGRAPIGAVEALAQRPGVLVTGEVRDTRPWIAQAALVVAPLRVARGIQNKILEAMAMARPVMASSTAAQGVGAQHGRHLWIADSAQDQAQAALCLLNDEARAVALAVAARSFVAARYDWQESLSDLPGHVLPPVRQAA